MRGRFTSTGTIALAALLVAGAAVSARADEPYTPVDLARPLAGPQSTLLMLDRGGAVLPFGALRFSAQVLEVDVAWGSARCRARPATGCPCASAGRAAGGPRAWPRATTWTGTA